MSGLFDLTDRVIVVTGGAGLLGEQHAAAIAAAGGVPVLVDVVDRDDVVRADVTSEREVQSALVTILDRHGRVDGLINNAAANPKVEQGGALDDARVESFPIERWNAELAVGLTGAFICSKVIGAELVRRGGGTIVNIASDLSVIAPDQRLYRRDGVPDDRQPVKPASYSVVKTGLIGLTRYLAAYWAKDGVRVNALSPGGVEAGQEEVFLSRISELIPLGRMARRDEYHGAIVFLCSDASSYLTGQNIVIDGGRSIL